MNVKVESMAQGQGFTTRRGFIGGIAAFAAVTGVEDVFANDSAALAATKRWFKDAQFGLMAHWGLYTLLGGEWNGRPGAHPYGEWIMHANKIPIREYAALANAFNPILFNPKEWMKRARDAGMKYFVITAKHHDGFALYHSRVSTYNVVDATPFRRDVVGELAEACREAGIRFGLYYSQDVDWHEPNGGGRHLDYGHYKDILKVSDEKRVWGNDWDFPDDSAYDFQRYLDEKAMPQVDELLTQYGDLCLLWFDVPTTLTREQSEAFVRLVRRRQPGCLVSGRIGNGLGDYETPHDNQIASKTETDKLYETVGTMNESWGYRPTDTNYKSVSEILAIKEKCAAIGSNYMLNVSPDPLGRIPVAGINILEGLAKARQA